MNVNVSYEFNFSEVHGVLNPSGSPLGLIYFARDPLRFIAP